MKFYVASMKVPLKLISKPANLFHIVLNFSYRVNFESKI